MNPKHLKRFICCCRKGSSIFKELPWRRYKLERELWWRGDMDPRWGKHSCYLCLFCEKYCAVYSKSRCQRCLSWLFQQFLQWWSWVSNGCNDLLLHWHSGRTCVWPQCSNVRPRYDTFCKIQPHSTQIIHCIQELWCEQCILLKFCVGRKFLCG